jgi:hypothetical protein
MSLALLRQQLADVIDGTRSATPGLSTGVATLDLALPGGGLPRGRLTEMVGAPGSGKTTIVRTMVERAIATGWQVAYIDATRTLAPRDWAKAGAQLVNGEPGLWVVRPDRPARGAWCADVLLRSGAFAFVVLDGAPMLERGVAVRLTRLAREADAVFLVLGDDAKASELAGSLRMRVVTTRPRRRTSERIGEGAAPKQIQVVIEKGAPYQTVNVGEGDRGNTVARRVRSYSEVPDRRGVARPPRDHARSRRCAEPNLPDEPFLDGAVSGTAAGATLGHHPDRPRPREAPSAPRRDLGRGTPARARGDDGARGQVALRAAGDPAVG